MLPPRECVVFLTRSVADSCRLGRLEALLETAGTERIPWLLYNVEPNATELLRLHARNPHLRLARQQNVTASAWRIFGGKMINYSKGAFLLWLLSEGSQCTHTWQIEDDVFFTGRWNTLFDAYAQQDTDLVALTQTISPADNWPWEARGCFVEPNVPCRLGGQLQSVVWPLLCLSRRLALELSHTFERGGHGFHEAIMHPVCARARWCSHAQLSAAHVGDIIAGHLGGVSKTQQTLELLALNLRKGWRTNASRLQMSAVPENKAFHPVKCEADQLLGNKARRWAGIKFR